MFHMLQWSGKGSYLFDAYYFQIQANGLIAYIMPISSGKWDRWRDDWLVVWAGVHDHLVLPIEPLTAKKTASEETLRLHVAFGPVIERIKHLTSLGLLVMMVLHDFLSRRIAPL
jgi:hypothetical protein